MTNCCKKIVALETLLLKSIFIKVFLFLPLLLNARPVFSQQKMLILQHVNVIDMTNGKIQNDLTIAISGNRIISITKTIKPVGEGDTVVDATGKFLIPGLWDMHVHIRNEENIFFPLLIANGVTGVRDMHNPFCYAEIRKWKDSINNSGNIAPYIGAAAGRIVDGYGDKRNLGFEIVKDSNEARKAVDSMKSYGADFIKVYNHLTLPEYLAIAEEAKKFHIPIAGHIPFGISLDTLVQAGQKSIEHMFDLPYYFSTDEAYVRKCLSDSVQSISKAKSAELDKLTYNTYDSNKVFEKAVLLKQYHVFICPTLWLDASVSYRDFVHSKEGSLLRTVPPTILAKWSPESLPRFSSDDSTLFFAYHQRALELVRLLHLFGVQIMAGTDSSPLWDYIIPGYSLQFELQMYVEAGMTPYEALKTATVNPAVYLHLEKNFGTIEQGKVANLVLLDANPLLDIKNTRKINAVIVNGKFLKHNDLDSLIHQAEIEIAQQRQTK